MYRKAKPQVLICGIVAVLGYLCFVPPAGSHGTEDSHQDHLERTIVADDSYELCLLLVPGQQLHYSFSAPRKLDFNIHYHAGHEVFYPVSEDQVMDAAATFLAESEQEYCLMWTNQGDMEVPLSLQYEIP